MPYSRLVIVTRYDTRLDTERHCCLLSHSLSDSGNSLEWRSAHVTGAMAHQILRREHPSVIETISAILKQHPWYVAYGQRQPEPDQTELLFMHAVALAP